MIPVDNWLANDYKFSIRKRIRGRGKNPVHITWGIGKAWFGKFAAGFSDFGLCWFTPLDKETDATVAQEIATHWSPAELERNDDLVHGYLLRMLYTPKLAQKLHLCGTEFQLSAWEALTCVPRGGSISYGDLAAMLGKSRAARALGNAVGANHVAIFVPCHRVLPVSGKLGNYRWGVDLKGDLLEQEGLDVPSAA
jgi:AraC family transcriptional regulator of adaptative response/methylated-DNA-[protein]-cysteine methyltransferase